MKKYFKFIYAKLSLIIIILVVGFSSSFLLGDIYNRNVAYYEASFNVVDVDNYHSELLNDEAYLTSIKESADKYSGINVTKMLKNNDFTYEIAANTISIKTKYKYYEMFFLSKSMNISTRAKTFVKDAVIGISPNVTFLDPDNIVTLYDYQDRWPVALWGTVLVFIVEVLVFSLWFYFLKNTNQLQDKVERRKIPFFTKEYWKSSIQPVKKVKQMTMIAMLFALMMASKFIPIPSGFGNLGLSFTYLFFSAICMIYGPVYGFVVGIFSDIIGYFINSGGGVFNLGYTLQAALTGFIYGLCFYKTKFNFTKTFIARLLVNFLMNVLLGSVLMIFVTYYTPEMDSKTFFELTKSYILYLSLPKNVLYLVPQSLLLFFVLKVTRPIFFKFNLLEKEEKIPEEDETIYITKENLNK